MLPFVCGVLMAFPLACGKKAPPFLPEKQMAARVDQLTGVYADGEVQLTGRIVNSSEGPEPTGCRVYQGWYPLDDPPCEGCPIQLAVLSGTQKIVISENRLVCAIPQANREGIGFFQVRLTDESGAEGPPSERIRLKIKD